MNVYFTSDLHFSHYNIIRYDNRPFTCTREMNEEIISKWNAVVGADDVTYILGDVSWDTDENTANLLKRLNGKKILICGNHDDNLGPLARREFAEIHFGYCEIKDPVSGKPLILSHYPIHFYNKQRRGAIMLYGHVHNMLDHDVVNEVADITKVRLGINFTMINVGCMHWDYTPQTLQQMLRKMKGT